MWGASAINERGHWEPRKANSLNLAILHRHGISPLDPSLHLQEEGAFDPEKNAGWIAKIRTYLTTLPAAPLVVISLLSGVWFERRIWPDSMSRL